MHRLNRIVGVETRIGQGGEVTAGEALQHAGEQTPRDVRPIAQHLIEIDAEIAEIAAERPEAKRRVGEIVAFSEFDETAERFEQAETAFH